MKKMSDLQESPILSEKNFQIHMQGWKGFLVKTVWTFQRSKVKKKNVGRILSTQIKNGFESGANCFNIEVIPQDKWQEIEEEG